MDLSENLFTEGINIIYHDSEWTPDRKIQYVNFTAHGNCRGFSGRAQFETTGRGIAHFVQELSTLVESLSGRAELTCGTGSDVYFKLELSWHDRAGHALLECHFRELYRGAYFQYTHLCQIIEYIKVVEIKNFFAATLSTESSISLDIPAVP